MVRKVRTTLGQLLGFAQEQGLVARNVVRDLTRSRTRGKEQRAEKRQRGKLKIDVDIPSTAEITKILAHAKGRWRALLLVAAFTGLRASELRGLTWKDVDFDAKGLHVRQRADRYNKIGKPKSHAGERSVPFGKTVFNTLREHKLSCARGDLDLVFPNKLGNVETLSNMTKRGFYPAQVAASVVTKGKPKYTGFHSLRHFYASWLINRKADGGREHAAEDGPGALGSQLDHVDARHLLAPVPERRRRLRRRRRAGAGEGIGMAKPFKADEALAIQFVELEAAAEWLVAAVAALPQVPPRSAAQTQHEGEKYLLDQGLEEDS